VDAGFVDLWQCGRADHRSLAWAIRFLGLNRSQFHDYAEDPNHFDQRIDLLLKMVPRDAVDFEVLVDLARSDKLADLTDGGDGVPSLWYLLYCTAKTGIGTPPSEGRDTAALL
jgi:hypothetical protein